MPPRKTRKAATPGPKRKGTKGPVGTVRSAPGRRAHGTPAAARLGEMLRANPADIAASDTATASASPRRSDLTFTRRLAAIVHGVFLVTMATKAQLRVFLGNQHVTTTADERWLEALTRYCGFTVVVQDLLECGAAFSEWLQVFVSTKSHNGDDQDKSTPDQETDATTAASATGLPRERMVVRLKLLRGSVPSVLEAETFIQERWEQSGDWGRSRVLLLRDFATGAAGKRSESSLSRAEAEDGSAGGAPVTANGDDSVDVHHVGVDGSGGFSDEELLGRLSKELRASLSENKLRAVVTQMRREALGVDAKEQERVNRRQVQERLLGTYDLLRVILGERRSVCNMTQLLHQMVSQNRFGDGRERVLEQLASLAQYQESGITLFSLHDGLEQRQQRDVEDGASSLWAKKMDVTCCSSQELETVLLSLDRRTASRSKLHAALQRD